MVVLSVQFCGLGSYCDLGVFGATLQQFAKGAGSAGAVGDEEMGKCADAASYRATASNFGVPKLRRSRECQGCPEYLE